MTREKTNWAVTLCNGSTADARVAWTWLAVLRHFLSDRPQRMATVRAMCDGRPAGVSPTGLAELRAMGIIDAKGEVLMVVRDVFVSAYRETVEGEVLGSPFSPGSEREVAVLRICEARSDTGAATLARRLGLAGPSSAPGR